MSGHSKWSTIKHKKAAEDAKRGKIFTKLAREITIAARAGGGDPTVNFSLRLVIDKAKTANMPKENIERAIKRGTGELKSAVLKEFTYEGYGPGGTALLMQVLTDNKKRAVADIRRVFNRMGGSLGESGSVAWQFDQKGYLLIEARDQDPEELALMAIDANADDIRIDDGQVEIYTLPTDFQRVKETMEELGVELAEAQLAMVPKTLLELDTAETLRTMRLIEALEDLDDVQQVYTNVDISDEVMAQYEEAA